MGEHDKNGGSRFPKPCLGDGSEPTTTLLTTNGDPELKVPLFRFEGEGAPVLLVHGASAWSGSSCGPLEKLMPRRR